MINNKYNHRNRNFFRRVLTSQKTLAVFGLLILMAIVLPLIKNINQKRVIEKEIKDMEGEIARVENKNNDLRKLIDYFESDQFVEEQARLNFGLKKNGEQVAVVKDQTAGSATTSGAEQIFNVPGLDKQPPIITEGNPSRWLKYFFINK